MTTKLTKVLTQYLFVYGIQSGSVFNIPLLSPQLGNLYTARFYRLNKNKQQCNGEWRIENYAISYICKLISQRC